MPKRVFVSASGEETTVSNALITQLNNAFEGALTFASAPRDLAAGNKWKSWLRKNLQECDAGLFLMTPKYKESPWPSAEFTAFWLAEKPIFILLVGDISADDLFRPMKDDYQSTRLDDVESIKTFFKNLSEFCGLERRPFEFAELLSFKCVEAYEECKANLPAQDPDFDPTTVMPPDWTYQKRHRLYSATWNLSLNEDHKTLRGECIREEDILCQSGRIDFVDVTVTQAANIVPFEVSAKPVTELLEYDYPNGKVSFKARRLVAGGDYSFRVRFAPPLTQGMSARVKYRFEIPALKVASVEQMRDFLLAADPDIELRNFESFVVKIFNPTDSFSYVVNFTGDCNIQPEHPQASWRRFEIMKESAELRTGAYSCVMNEDGGWSMTLSREHPTVETIYRLKWKLPRQSELG